MDIEDRHEDAHLDRFAADGGVLPVEMDHLQNRAVSRGEYGPLFTGVVPPFRVPEKKDDEDSKDPKEHRDIKMAKTGEEDGQSAAGNNKGDSFLRHRPCIVNP